MFLDEELRLKSSSLPGPGCQPPSALHPIHSYLFAKELSFLHLSLFVGLLGQGVASRNWGALVLWPHLAPAAGASLRPSPPTFPGHWQSTLPAISSGMPWNLPWRPEVGFQWAAWPQRPGPAHVARLIVSSQLSSLLCNVTTLASLSGREGIFRLNPPREETSYQ